MLEIRRSGATIQVTVHTVTRVLVFDESCGAEATGYLERMLTNAFAHERRIMSEQITNEFYDRIQQLQNIINDLQSKPKKKNGGSLNSGNVIDADFLQIEDKRGRK